MILMGTSLLIGFITYLVYIMFANKKKQDKSKVELVETLKNIYSNSVSYNNDNVTEINNINEAINYQEYLTTYLDGVPEWKFQYVYEASEIEQATQEQKDFYKIFKEAFKNKVYYDLENNSNYSFVLLFDLRDEYDVTKDINLFENRIKQLGLYYPKTRYYGKSIVLDKMESLGDYSAISRINNDKDFNNNQYDLDYYKLGSKFKKKMNLSTDEVNLLNKLWSPTNNFCSIEFCCIQVIKIYLTAINKLSEKFEKNDLEKEFSRIADIIVSKEYNLSMSNYEFKYSIESTTNQLYQIIFKKCENLVREKYDHKRKINTELNYTKPESIELVKKSFLDNVDEILSNLGDEIINPDLRAEIELNFQNTTRWKKRFEILKTNYSDPLKFRDDILNLGEQNKKNSSIETIFFEASKFMVAKNKEVALELYINYIYHDVLSVTFNNKKLTKTIQKSLFSNEQQLMEFENIINDLIKNKNLKSALDKVKLIYKIKRKSIELNENQISEVQKQHSSTVELLNEYLEDVESEHEIELFIEKDIPTINNTIINESIKLTENQILLLEIFKKNDLRVLQSDVDIFAKSKNVFKNYLIDSINEVCFETLDDILIEEIDEFYVINEDNLKIILT
jgi:hypothetical protein